MKKVKERFHPLSRTELKKCTGGGDPVVGPCVDAECNKRCKAEGAISGRCIGNICACLI